MRKSDRGQGAKGKKENMGRDRKNEKNERKGVYVALCEYVCANAYVCV